MFQQAKKNQKSFENNYEQFRVNGLIILYVDSEKDVLNSMELTSMIKILALLKERRISV